MRVLCCLDGSNLESISQALRNFVRSDTLTLAFLHVVDNAPHEDMGRQRNRFFRSSQQPRYEQMQQAEQIASQDILTEATRLFPDSLTLTRQGRPEREIVNYAAEWETDLLLLCPRSIPNPSPLLGPKSVGHIARFVLDHAPCAVLLARPPVRDHFPLDPKPPTHPHDRKRPG